MEHSLRVNSSTIRNVCCLFALVLTLTTTVCTAGVLKSVLDPSSVPIEPASNVTKLRMVSTTTEPAEAAPSSDVSVTTSTSTTRPSVYRGSTKLFSHLTTEKPAAAINGTTRSASGSPLTNRGSTRLYSTASTTAAPRAHDLNGMSYRGSATVDNSLAHGEQQSDKDSAASNRHLVLDNDNHVPSVTTVRPASSTVAFRGTTKSHSTLTTEMPPGKTVTSKRGNAHYSPAVGDPVKVGGKLVVVATPEDLNELIKKDQSIAKTSAVSATSTNTMRSHRTSIVSTTSPPVTSTSTEAAIQITRSRASFVSTTSKPSVATTTTTTELPRVVPIIATTESSQSEPESATSHMESYHFDINRYKSEYEEDTTGSVPTTSEPDTRKRPTSASSRGISTRRQTSARMLSSYPTTTDTDDYSVVTFEPDIGNFSNNDFERKFQNIVLTPPRTSVFDDIHRQYQSEEEGGEDDDAGQGNDLAFTEATVVDHGSKEIEERYQEYKVSEPKVNSTSERNSTLFYDAASVESRSYDLATNEVRNASAPDSDNLSTNGTAEKKAKYLQNTDSDSNLTIPNTAEVWALAAMKKTDYVKEQRGQAYNITAAKVDPPSTLAKNNTMVSKQLADWAEVMKHDSFANHSAKVILNDTAQNPPLTRGSVKHQNTIEDNVSQENQVVLSQVSLPPPGFVDPTTNSITDTTLGPDGTKLLPATQKSVLPADHTSTTESTLLTAESSPKEKTVDFKHINAIPFTVKESQDSIESNVVTTLNQPTEHQIIKHDDTKPDIVQQNPSIVSEEETQTESSSESSPSEANTEYVVVDATDSSSVETIQDADDDPSVESTTVMNVDDESQTEKFLGNEATTPVSIEATESTQFEDSTPSQIDISTEKTTVTTERREDSIEQNLIVKTSETKSPSTMGPTSTTVTTTTTTTSAPVTTTTSIPTTLSTLDQDYDIDAKFTTITIDVDDEESRNSSPNHNNNEDWEVLPNAPPTEIPIKRAEVSNNDSTLVVDRTLKPKSIPAVEPSEEPNDVSKVPTERTSVPSDTQAIDSYSNDETDVNAIVAITVSVVGVICLVLLVVFLFVMRKRQKLLTYGQRCRPVGLDAYSLDNVSVFNSVRRKGHGRQSKRVYGNAAFDDPELKNHPLTMAALATFVTARPDIYQEFKDLPTVTARIEDVPVGCEEKNRYANIVPLPETRCFLKKIGEDETSEYINANYVKGPKDTSHYYIATQAPLENTCVDFWRMIWEQNSRVIIMATDLNENGIERCAEYLPPSVVLDNHLAFGDFQVTLKSREVKDKYAVSTLHLKNAATNTWREITHFWYQWPDDKTGAPVSEQPNVVAMLLEARSYLKVTVQDQTDSDEKIEKETDNGELKAGVVEGDKSRSLPRFQGPLTVHCSPGTGRTGTIIACDIALRELELPTRSVDIPRIVYFVRNGRANAVATREQYEFIYKVAHMYATKLTGPNSEN